MNKFQRKYAYKKPINSLEAKKNRSEVEELWALQSRQMKSRCCYITPDQLNSLATYEPLRTHQNVNVAEPYRPTVTKSNPVPKPVKPNPLKMITIADPSRPALSDMRTIPKQTRRPYVHIISEANKRPPLRPSPRSAMARKSSSTLPDESVISEPFAFTKHEMKAAAAQVSSTLPSLHDLTVDQPQELRKASVPSDSKQEKASQYVKPKIAGSIKEIKRDKSEKILRGKDEETLTQYHNQSKNLLISEIPHIKLVAVKSTKYKKENIELRRIEEKIVCVEYDVFDKGLDEKAPVQKMRAFFSINPIASDKDAELTELPPTIKSQFKISTDDLQRLSQKEIEIIDGKIIENQPYLNDLRKLLRRKANASKNKNTFNLQALYDMAKKDMLDFDNNLDIKMPKEELVAMRNFILKNCKSNVEGLRRKTVRSNSKMFEQIIRNTISENLETELRRSNKNVADHK